MMLVQVCFLVWAVLLLREHFAFVYAGLLGLNAVLIVYITNRNENPSYKMAWLIIIAILPIFGGLAYLYLKTRLDSRQFFKRYEKKVFFQHKIPCLPEGIGRLRTCGSIQCKRPPYR